MRRILIIVAIILVPAIPIVLLVSGVLKSKPTTVSPVTLTVWGTADERLAFAALAKRYAIQRPYATVTYQVVPAEGYYDRLVSAWAQGNGPDLFFVPQTWIGQMTEFATPMPAQLGVPIVKTGTGLFRNGTEIVQQSLPAPSVTSLKNTFVDAVAQDAVIDGQVWGLPLSMDTIVLYSNKDLLNNAKVFEPAKTWGELLQQLTVNGLTVADDQQSIVQAGVALGSVDNVPYAADLMALLMLQNGWPAIQPNQDSVHMTEAAQTAMDFWLSFANPKKVAYSWNAQQPNAREDFLAGKLAYYFGTLADLATIKKSAVNWAVSPMLHLSTDGDRDGLTNQARVIDAARYDMLMVSKSSQLQGRSTQAWNLLNFVTYESTVPVYLQMTGKLSALRSILSTQKDDPELGTFAAQLLTAKTWYHGHGGQKAEGYLRDLSTSVLEGKATLEDALRLAGEQLTASL